MKGKCLTFKLIVGGFLLVSIPLLVNGFFSVYKAKTSLTELGRGRLLDRAGDLGARIDALVQEELALA
jgi:methyl-accepting chemotaxis protein